MITWTKLDIITKSLGVMLEIEVSDFHWRHWQTKWHEIVKSYCKKQQKNRAKQEQRNANTAQNWHEILKRRKIAEDCGDKHIRMSSESEQACNRLINKSLVAAAPDSNTPAPDPPFYHLPTVGSSSSVCELTTMTEDSESGSPMFLRTERRKDFSTWEQIHVHSNML